MSARRRQRSRSSARSSQMKRGYDVVQHNFSGAANRKRNKSSVNFSQLSSSLTKALMWLVLGFVLVGMLTAIVVGIWLFFAFSHRTINQNTVQNIVIYPSEKSESKNEYLLANIDFKSRSFFVLKRPALSLPENTSPTLVDIAKDTGVFADQLWVVDKAQLFEAKGPEQLAWQITQLNSQSTWTLGDRWWAWWETRGFRSGRIGWYESGADKGAINTWLASVQPLPDSASCNFAVLNATAQSGVAAELANELEQNHLVVVRVDGSDLTLNKTQLLIDTNFDSDCNRITERVRKNLPETTETKRLNNIFQYYRAPLVILVGQDLTTVSQN